MFENALLPSPPQSLLRAWAGADALADTTTSGTQEATIRQLRPLGHQVTLWRDAATLLHGRLQKGKLAASLQSFLQRWAPREAPEAIPGTFELVLTQAAEGAPVSLHSASFSFPADLQWRALLHLPAMQSLWAGDLRGSHLQNLLKVVPRAWMIDSAPLSPGAVIGGLGASSWEAFAASTFDPTGFSLHSIATGRGQQPQSATEWKEAILENLGGSETLLVEQPKAAIWWLARYARSDGHIDLAEAGVFAADDNGL